MRPNPWLFALGIAFIATGSPALATDTWQTLPPAPSPEESAGVYDPVRDRLIVFSGRLVGDGVWALPFGPSQVWESIVPAGPGPTDREGHSAIYDPVRDRVLFFGGWYYDTIAEESVYLDEVWELALSPAPAWTLLTPAGTPPSGRRHHTAVYDPSADRMIVFGGNDGTSDRNDVWALSLTGSGAWTQLTPAGTPPTARINASAVVDTLRSDMVLFGGSNTNEVWVLELSGAPVWSQVTPAGTPPSGRSGHGAVLDAAGDRMVIFAGGTGFFNNLNDAWSLALGATPAWTQLTPGGSPPSPRGECVTVWDDARSRMVAFGGRLNSSPYRTNEVWSLDLGGAETWALLDTGSFPPRRNGAAFCHDPVRNRMLVFGGSDGSYLGDLWAMDLNTNNWEEIVPSGTPPAPRSHASMVFDSANDRAILFAGGTSQGYMNDVWELAFDPVPAWTQLAPSGTPPALRSATGAIYDPIRQRLLIFGGVGQATPTRYNDVWSLSLGAGPTWMQLLPSGTPPSTRGGPRCVWDPVRDRMIVYGGFGFGFDSHPSYGDIFAMSLDASPAWTELLPPNPIPGGRTGGVFVYDAGDDQIVLHAGGAIGAFISYRDDTWTYDLSSDQWDEVVRCGAVPEARVFHAGVYDPVADRVVIAGGSDVNKGPRDDVWELSGGQPVGVPTGPVTPPFRAHAFPNPFALRLTVSFHLESNARVQLTLHDLAGRLVTVPAAGEYGSGAHQISWDASRHDLPAGVYFYRLTAGDRSASGRVLRLP